MTTQTFSDFNLTTSVLSSLKNMNFSEPTAIQAQAIPMALLGKDVFGTAQTGTGKTAAYGIPLIEHLMKNPKSKALILTPTRELAFQVLQMLEKIIGQTKGIKSALLIGGDSMSKQLTQLSFRPRLIVGTPGRINDHISRKTLELDSCDFLVLDETDRMLDMGFGVQLETIIPCMAEERQTMMFSATMAPNIEKIAKKYLNDACVISIGSSRAASENVQQESIHMCETEKYDHLVQHLDESEGSFIVFSNTKIGTHQLAKKLRANGYQADAIHGDLRQRDREKVIRSFHKNKIRILVATDVAARGLDIPHIEYVVNYDLPMCPEDYIHRIGRTGRAGAQGRAISFISNQDQRKWRAICDLMNPEKKQKPQGMSRGASKGAPSDRRKRFSGPKPVDGGDFGRSERREFGARKSDYSKSEPREFGSRKSDYNRSEPRDFGARKSDRSRSEPRDFGARKSDYSKSEPRDFGARKSDYSKSEPRDFGARKSDRSRSESRDFGARKSMDRKPSGRRAGFSKNA